MIVIDPIKVVSGNLVSNIPEPDAGEVEWVSGTYNQGDEVIKSSTHRKYRATTTTTEDPEVGVLQDPPTWVDISPTNKFAMFDGVISTQSSSSDTIEVEITPGSLANGLAAFNLDASSVDIEVSTLSDGVVYSRTIDLRDNSAVTDYYQYFFTPIITKFEFALFDLPLFPSATTKVTFNKAGSDVFVGELVLGRQFEIGVAEYGTSLQLLDFSVRERDEFGNFIVNRRRTSKLVDFDGYCMTSAVNNTFKQLSRLSTIPCVWSGNPEEEDDPTLIYGYYKDMTINISGPSTSDVTIQVEGLV